MKAKDVTYGCPLDVLHLVLRRHISKSILDTSLCAVCEGTFNRGTNLLPEHYCSNVLL